MFIPLKDLNPSRTYPFVNITLILANIVVFLYQIGLEATLPRRAFDALLLSYSTVPARFPAFLAGHASFEISFLPLATSMFLHSGFLHLAGNMLFLWIFGDNVEDFFGHIGYFFFYLACGIGVRPSDIFVLAHLISATRYTHALLWQLSSQTRSSMHARNPLSSAPRPVSSIQANTAGARPHATAPELPAQH